MRGAPEGAYRVTIGFPTPAMPAVMSRLYTVEPKDNVFRFEIDKPRGGGPPQKGGG